MLVWCFRKDLHEKKGRKVDEVVKEHEAEAKSLIKGSLVCAFRLSTSAAVI